LARNLFYVWKKYKLKNITLSILSISLLLLSSCSQKKQIHILTDDAKGIQVSAPMIYKGMKIGEVKSLNPHKDQILISVELEDKIQISKNSSCIISDELNTKKSIKISQLGNPAYVNNDTVKLESALHLFPNGFADDVKNVIIEVDKIGTLLDQIMRKIE
jgi:hypothetical protein